MASDYMVKQGDCLLSIADRYGFFPETLWNHAKNRELKQQRKDPNTLAPGDLVHIPDVETKQESKAQEKRHRFRRKGVPGKLKIRLLDDGEPRKHADYRLVIDGKVIEGKTDGDGYLEQELPAGAQRGELIIDREDGGTDHYEFQFGTVDPIDTPSGQKQRLHDLGFDPSELKEAVRGFQRAQDLEPSGDMDEKTKSKLREVFGQ